MMLCLTEQIVFRIMKSMIKNLNIFACVALMCLMVETGYTSVPPIHFPDPHHSSLNMSILILEISGINVVDSSEIAVLTPDDIVAGAIVLDGEPSWGMAAWADDLSTDEIDGFQAGDTMVFLFWDPISREEIQAEIDTIMDNKGPYFAGDGYLVIRLNVEPPELEWTDVPREIIENAGAFITFTVKGISHTYLDDLTISYTSDNLPPEVNFIDNGDGSGTFSWQTTVSDSGSYQALFILTNGAIEIRAVVQIRVVAPSPPEWIVPPQNIEGEERGLIEFEIEGTDINNDMITIQYWSPDIPASARLFHFPDGTARFRWQTTIYDAGDYTAQFTLSDGIYDVITTITISISESVVTDSLYALDNPEPNPFYGTATVRYSIPVNADYRLRAFDLSGRLVKLLGEGYEQGEYSASINSYDLPCGLYLFMLEVGTIRRYSSGVALRNP